MNIQNLRPDEIKILRKLLEKYPNGFALMPNLRLYEIVQFSFRLSRIVHDWIMPPDGGGFFVAKKPDD